MRGGLRSRVVVVWSAVAWRTVAPEPWRSASEARVPRGRGPAASDHITPSAGRVGWRGGRTSAGDVVWWTEHGRAPRATGRASPWRALPWRRMAPGGRTIAARWGAVVSGTAGAASRAPGMWGPRPGDVLPQPLVGRVGDGTPHRGHGSGWAWGLHLGRPIHHFVGHPIGSDGD